MITQKGRNHGYHLATLQHLQLSQIFMEKNSCCVFGISLMSCIMSFQTIRTITSAVYRTQLIRLSRALKEKRAHYYSRDDKVIFLHHNTRPHVAAPVKTYLETLKWKVLPHPPYSASSDFHLFRSMMYGLFEQHFTSYENTQKLGRFVDSLKR